MSNTNQPAVTPKEHVVVPETRFDFADYFSVNVADGVVRVNLGRFRPTPAPQIVGEVDIISSTVLVGNSGPNFIAEIAKLHAQLVANGVIVDQQPAPASTPAPTPSHVILPRQ